MRDNDLGIVCDLEQSVKVIQGHQYRYQMKVHMQLYRDTQF